MPGKYILYSLDVGQGMGTFLTYYDSKKVLKAVALFDIGSSHNKSKIEEPVVEFLKKKIIERSKPNGYLDAMFISHKDSDHVNLIQQLLDAVPDATIGKVRYGGRRSWYKKSKGNILNELDKRIEKGKSRGFPIGHSNWNSDKDLFEKPIWESDGEEVQAFLLAANTPFDEDESGSEDEISARPDGDQANSKSLVIALSMDDVWAIISGDATYPSFDYINGYFDSEFEGNIMTLLPHHASRKTTFGLPKSDGEISEESMEVVTTFAKNMHGLTVVASADTKHGHPSLETIEVFLEYTDQAKSWWEDKYLADLHYVTVMIDTDINRAVPYDYTTYRTGNNVYSTRYFRELADPPFSYPPYQAITKKQKTNGSKYSPPEGMNWVYASDGTEDGTTLVGEDSGRLDALTEMLLEADLSIGLPPAALPAPAPPAAMVSDRQAAPGLPRPAIAPPRSASAFSRLMRVL